MRRMMKMIESSFHEKKCCGCDHSVMGDEQTYHCTHPDRRIDNNGNEDDHPEIIDIDVECCDLWERARGNDGREEWATLYHFLNEGKIHQAKVLAESHFKGIPKELI